MNKLKELFFGSKQDKLTDKAFTQSIAVSVISILLCVVALCSVTWAWFSEDVSSSSNTIKTGTYSLNMEIKDDDSEAMITGTENEGAYKSYQYSLAVGKAYTITLTADTGSDSNGYCKILVDGVAQPYYTSIVPSNASGELTNPCTFTFVVKSDATTTDTQTIDVTFELRWGTYSGSFDVSNGGTLECTLPSN